MRWHEPTAPTRTTATRERALHGLVSLLEHPVLLNRRRHLLKPRRTRLGIVGDLHHVDTETRADDMPTLARPQRQHAVGESRAKSAQELGLDLTHKAVAVCEGVTSDAALRCQLFLRLRRALSGGLAREEVLNKSHAHGAFVAIGLLLLLLLELRSGWR